MGRPARSSFCLFDDEAEQAHALAVSFGSSKRYRVGSVVGERDACACVCLLRGKADISGHFNRPDPEVARAAAEEEKRLEKEKEAKEKEREKAKAKAKAQAEAEAEAKAKAKKKEEEARAAKEMEKAKMAAAEKAKQQAIEDRYKLKLWRTKVLAMIIGISLCESVRRWV
jgi:flagellar biosynthesis GTPase FlhF